MAIKITEQTKKNIVELGKTLEDIRVSQNITISDVTNSTGLKYDQVKSIENGSANYTIQALLSYCESIKVDLLNEIVG